MVEPVNVGAKRVWVTAYNPADALSLLYCRFVLGRLRELLADTTAEEVHAWLRKNVEGVGPYLDKIDDGWKPDREVPIGEFPLTPGNEAMELRIVEWLKNEARLQHVNRIRDGRMGGGPESAGMEPGCTRRQ